MFAKKFAFSRGRLGFLKIINKQRYEHFFVSATTQQYTYSPSSNLLKAPLFFTF